jgi:hypothetical protein
METIAFNTGRKYAANGQPVSAAFDAASGAIAFVDHARLIEGVLRDRTPLSQAAVMAAYDAGRYDMPRAADMPLINAARAAYVEGASA